MHCLTSLHLSLKVNITALLSDVYWFQRSFRILSKVGSKFSTIENDKQLKHTLSILCTHLAKLCFTLCACLILA